MSDTAAAVARLLQDDGQCPAQDPPDGRWIMVDMGYQESPLPMWIRRRRPHTSGRGVTSPGRLMSDEMRTP